jgi:hypothetical protein
MMETLELQAEIIWVGHEIFGVRFENINNEQKELLWERLVFESRCALP